MEQILSFLQALKQHNNREWFNQHKDEYSALRLQFEEYVDELIQLMLPYDEELSGLRAKDCLYRIYRDIRFSYDKTPYKTHFAAYLAKGGKKSPRGGYYLHIEPGNCLLSGGVWSPEPKLLRLLRQAVFDNFEEFREIMENPVFKRLYPGLDGEKLKTVPRPFPKDTPASAYLKYKDFVVLGRVQDRYFSGKDWKQNVVTDFRKLIPFNRFLNYTVDELYQ